MAHGGTDAVGGVGAGGVDGGGAAHGGTDAFGGVGAGGVDGGIDVGAGGADGEGETSSNESGYIAE